jgi:D-serine dehydratase
LKPIVVKIFEGTQQQKRIAKQNAVEVSMGVQQPEMMVDQNASTPVSTKALKRSDEGLPLQEATDSRGGLNSRSESTSSRRKASTTATRVKRSGEAR